MDALFLDHYDRELSYLREMGNAFATKYPRLAGRLGLDEFQCSDPFVERLLEGFAFLSARVHRRLDAEFPQLTRAIFDSVFPHYARPIPSVGIFQLNPAHDEGSLVEGYSVPKGSRLHSEPAPGEQTGCRFDTVNDVQLWPLRIARFEYISRDSVSTVSLPGSFLRSNIRGLLHLVLETTAAIPINALKLDRLRLHFRGGEISHQLYEAMLAHSKSISLSGPAIGSNPTEQSWTQLNPNQIVAVGFDHHESFMPSDNRTFSGYRLLQDYFALPEKFLFVDLVGLRSSLVHCSGNRLHLILGLEQIPGKQIERVAVEHVALHCVPAVNLFPRRADRVHLDHSQHEQHLICDRSRPLDFEVWSIERMALHQTATAHEGVCLPLYAPPQGMNDSIDAFYYAVDRRTRVPSTPDRVGNRSAYLGTEVFVSLTDSQAGSSAKDFQQLSTQVYCTNRDLALLQPEGGWRTAFRFEAAGPIANVLCLTGPTWPRPSLLSQDGETAWRLVSHLTPNYLSLSDSERGGAIMLRELLQLYCYPDDHSMQRQIEGIQKIWQKPIVRRLQRRGPMTFAQGLEVELHFDEEAFGGRGAFLLGSILEQFFARYVTLNSFTETHIVSNSRGSIHRWAPRSGTVPLL